MAVQRETVSPSRSVGSASELPDEGGGVATEEVGALGVVRGPGWAGAIAPELHAKHEFTSRLFRASFGDQAPGYGVVVSPSRGRPMDGGRWRHIRVTSLQASQEEHTR